MLIQLRPATDADFDFAFSAKKQAIGPHAIKRWPWDENWQINLHRQRWSERTWFIIENDDLQVGTVCIDEHADHIRFGEFYVLPPYQNQGIGSQILQNVIARSEQIALPIKLEYLKWNPVGALYLRHGFKVISENEIHYFLIRELTLNSKPSTQRNTP